MTFALIGLWVAWFVYWWIAATRANPARFKQTGGSGHAVLVCWILLLIPSPTLIALPTTGLVLVILGLGLTVWARLHLGRSWAGDLSIQYDHKLIQTGPYAIIRHPIYSGLLMAYAGTALAGGSIIALFAPLIAFIGFRYKIRVEEFQLTQIFPEYPEYKKIAPALIPDIVNIITARARRFLSYWHT